MKHYNNYSYESQEVLTNCTEIGYNCFSMEFSDWITQKYIQWRGNRIGNHASVAEFAKLFGASQPLMSDWMKPGGKVPRATKFINALVAHYGNEVYEVLGLPVPTDPFAAWPPELRPAAEELARVFSAMGPPFDRPEVIAELQRILKKYGATDIEISE